MQGNSARNQKNEKLRKQTTNRQSAPKKNCRSSNEESIILKGKGTMCIKNKRNSNQKLPKLKTTGQLSFDLKKNEEIVNFIKSV